MPPYLAMVTILKNLPLLTGVCVMVGATGQSATANRSPSYLETKGVLFLYFLPFGLPFYLKVIKRRDATND